MIEHLLHDYQRWLFMVCGGLGRVAIILIEMLDLKVFVHRSVVQRFSYRSMMDHFGAEVTLLRKVLKNTVEGNGYVLVTKAASFHVNFDDTFDDEKYKRAGASYR